MTAPRAGGGWPRSAAERIRRALLPVLVTALGLFAALGVAACGSTKPTAHDQPLKAPPLAPLKDSASSATSDTSTDTTTTDTTATGTTSSGTTASGTSGTTSSGTTSGTTGTGTVAPSTSSGTGGTAAPTTGTGTGTGTGTAGGAAPGSTFCTANPGAC